MHSWEATMRRALAICTIMLSTSLLPGAAGATDADRQVERPDGTIVRSIDAAGTRDASPASRSGAEVRRPCEAGAGEGWILRERASIDACGRGGEGRESKTAAQRAPRELATIDRMTTGWQDAYQPGGLLYLMGPAVVYTLSDGSSWESGAGTAHLHQSQVTAVSVSGSTIRYTLSPPAAGYLYEQTDYDTGDHSSQGTLGPAGPLVLEAQTGATTGVIRGAALVVSNEATWYGVPRFNYFSAVVGSIVPFELTYTLEDSTFTPQTFATSFAYHTSGLVDFAHPIAVSRLVGLEIAGVSQVPDESTTTFTAWATYESGAQRDVSAAAAWTVQPDAHASIAGGLLTVGTLTDPQETLTLGASYAEDGETVSATRQVVALRDDPIARLDTWPMFQADARHTGSLPIHLDPSTFALRWQRSLGSQALNAVTGGDGKVFVSKVVYFQDVPSLFALSAADGHTLWEKQFGSIFSVNPPSYAYGNVYVQTGNHETDTYLRAFDATTGAPVFQAPHAAQWERYFAPTVEDGKVFVNGGTYGGMYGFDASTGQGRWFSSLPQYDQWTPAVAGGRAYAYVGEYTPGLYVRDSTTGAPIQFIPDPDFEWGGWSMNLAPVIGARDDVLAIQDGRLISFDIAHARVGWQVAGQFTGQPSVAQDRIYAVDGGRLVVLDEKTHAPLWSWQPPVGALRSPLIVTRSHVLASTETTTYAVDVLTRQSVWSYAKGGQLALADSNLYIASTDGTLTAIVAPIVVPSPLVYLEIEGPGQMVENTTGQFQAVAHYADGTALPRTGLATWSVATPGAHASVTAPGQLLAGELVRPQEDILLRAQYTEEGRTAQATLPVRLVIGVPLKRLVNRNLLHATNIKRDILSRLDEALDMERAALEVAPKLEPVSRAVCLEERARNQIALSLFELGQILNPLLGLPSPVRPAAPPTNEACHLGQ